MSNLATDIATLAKQWVSKILDDRVPMTASRTPIGGGFFGSQFGATGKFDALTSSGWLFACVNVIATGMAKAEWSLNREQRNGEGVIVTQHPLWELWQNPNPFKTRFEFIQASVNHFEIAGEIIWLVVRGMTPSVPLELWPIRPDRIQVIPDPDDYIKGYLYSIGSERIFLNPEDVIFIKRESPTSEYRGMGVIEAILTEVSGDELAARWTRNFYANSAQPGGIIEYDSALSDTEFKRATDRWRQQHQGVANAHRVAVLEKGKFTPLMFNQRNMGLIDQRKLNRDMILEAFGIPKSILGIDENTNRATAREAKAIFAEDVITPRLELTKQKVNMDLVPILSVNQGLFFDYADPVPANRELNFKIAISGFKGSILNRNEARALLGQGALIGPEGEEFAPVSSGGGFGGGNGLEQLSIQRGNYARSSPWGRAIADGLFRYEDAQFMKALPGQDDVNPASDAIRDGWERRLESEVEALIKHLESRDSETASIARWLVKLEPGDVESYDWDWLAKHGAEVEDELVEVFFAAITSEFAEIAPSEAGRLASEYASNRGAELLNLDSDISINRMARDRVRQATANAIENGDSLGQLSKTLREDFAFSKQRADLIARTEAATALGQGEKKASALQGRTHKRWVTQGDDRVDAECRANEAAGDILIDAVFPSGKQTIPEHPRCRCRVRSFTKTEEGGEERSIETRCPECNKFLGQDVTGSPYCVRCKALVEIA